MKTIMNKVFLDYCFTKVWEDDEREFYKCSQDNRVTFFILNYIDCSDMGDNIGLISDKLSGLEREYVDEDKEREGIKYSIINSLENNLEVSQIDKNTSAIYLMRVPEEYDVSKFRNLIYAIEESHNYFRRFIIPYCDSQVNGLESVFLQYSDRTSSDVLSDLADDQDNYFRLMDGKADNGVYSLVIRMFSKIPFLQYRFAAQIEDFSLENMVTDSLEGIQVSFDAKLCNGTLTASDCEEYERNYLITEEEINSEINRILEEI